MFTNNNIVFMLFLTTASITITVTQSASFENPKTGKSFVNEATSPGSISSRFLDLGGVISQLFSGFNQATPGGSSGLNFPPNSQFYPGVLAQDSNFRPPIGFENKWSNLNQGIIQGNNLIGGFESQQPNRPHPSSLNFNSQTVQHQGQLSKQAQDLAQTLNIQYKKPQPNLYTSQPKGNSRYQRSEIVSSNLPRSPHDVTSEGDQFGAVDARNEGTLEDFFTTESTHNNDNHKVMFPNREDTMTTKTAIWGKQVKIPTTTLSSDAIIFVDDDHTETPYQKQCVQNCPTTSEYNPVCGSDSVTYFNPGRLVCARNCGINVRERRLGSCSPQQGR